jgi:hypothetical protein
VSDDVLLEAREAFAKGQADEALREAWKVTMPAVLGQDADQLARSAAFAEKVACATSGGTQKEARQYAAYWAACVDSPRADQGSAWSVKRWFERTPKD